MIRIKPIGTVHEIDDSDEMKIEIYQRYVGGLKGIESLDKIDVYYWMHELEDSDERLEVHPRGNPERPLTGVFALRSPIRPNSIGETKVDLVRREGNELFVRNLDAYDGSPVIDIKSG